MLFEFAPAKLNLYLHILGKRDDGYHDLESLIAFCSVGDIIAVYPDDNITLSVTGLFSGLLLDNINDNLVIQSARALQNRLSLKKGAKIFLKKNLPIGAGIGGGSADSAATLRLLQRLWNVTAPEPMIYDIASEIGADVPVCIDSQARLVSSTGVTLHSPISLPPIWAVLVNSGEFLATKHIFKELKIKQQRHPPTDRAIPLHALQTSENLLLWIQSKRNDLECIATELYSTISHILEELHRMNPQPQIVRMSGSGGTCFALYLHEHPASIACLALQEKHPAWSCQVVCLT
jgi:4-diphosphocytidyl-2-C-methyl-D-erythritol kinase